MKNTEADILAQLQRIEHKYQISIFLAVGSGSRAWNYPFLDSDYDVRFLYHHQADWYISAFQKRDNIDWATIHNIDLAGWDISKCVKLLHKGNASLYEWLASPIIYTQHTSKVTRLAELAGKAFNSRRMFNHYFFLAQKRMLDETRLLQAKWFLYTLRELLSARWILENSSPPPGDFEHLCRCYIGDTQIRETLDTFITAKTQALKRNAPEAPLLLRDYCKNLLGELDAAGREAELTNKHLGDTEVYDQVLRAIIFDDAEQ